MSANLQLSWMLAESFLLVSCLYLLLRARVWLGNAPLFIAIGALQFLQVVLAIGVYVEILPGLIVSPGSAVLFIGTITGVLLVYLVEDAEGARRLIYGLLLANGLLSLLTLSVSVHLLGPAARPLLDIPIEIFLQNPRVMVVGTVVLFLDTILVILVYEGLSRISSLFIRLWLTLSVVLLFDSLMFVTGVFVELDSYTSIMWSSVVGKLIMALPAALAIALLHRLFDRAPLAEAESVGDIFNLLTYRQRYESIRKESRIDPLTGLLNRRALDEQLASMKDSDVYALLLIDIDKFKAVNDDLGHAAGDVVLAQVATALRSSLRDRDAAYRFGGEEFLIVVRNASCEEGARVGERVREHISDSFSAAPVSDGRDITVTIGVSSSPEDDVDSDRLFEVADQRLYQGKSDGRDRVVWQGEYTTGVPSDADDAA
jgi:diguanylate cyclase (GGDEF)-like protein